EWDTWLVTVVRGRGAHRWHRSGTIQRSGYRIWGRLVAWLNPHLLRCSSNISKIENGVIIHKVMPAEGKEAGPSGNCKVTREK
ncbi:hypothetical protein RJ035_006227, partial [Blastomyces gilchristii]